MQYSRASRLKFPQAWHLWSCRVPQNRQYLATAETRRVQAEQAATAAPTGGVPRPSSLHPLILIIILTIVLFTSASSSTGLLHRDAKDTNRSC